MFLKTEPWGWSGLSGPDGEGHWQASFDRRIRAFRDVTNLNDYWARRHRPWEPVSTPPASEATTDSGPEANVSALLKTYPGVLEVVLLKWIYRSAGGSVTEIVTCSQFRPAVPPPKVEDALRRLDIQGQIGLYWPDPAPALARAQLTNVGAERAEQSAKNSNSRIFRDRSARDALLAWPHDHGETPQGSALEANFLRDTRSVIDGHFISSAELDSAAAYRQAKDSSRAPDVSTSNTDQRGHGSPPRASIA